MRGPDLPRHPAGGPGEAGLGKTALLAETRRIAEARGCTVWSARGGETLRSVPFNVVRQLLQPALVSMLPEEAREYLGDWYGIAGPALGIADPGERQADPQGVCDGLVAAVRRLARREWPWSCSSTTPTGPTRRPCAGSPRSPNGSTRPPS